MLATEKAFVIRLNAWQRPRDKEKREAFAFDVAHNHDFNFLTIGYLGPGYDTDIWQLDLSGFVGYVGEKVRLTPRPRARLTEGRIMHYRRDVDVHVQLDPPAFSMSLNLIPKTPRQSSSFAEQYEFDIGRSTVSLLLPGLATRQADLVTIAAEVGTDSTDEVVKELFAGSPNRHTRLASLHYLLRTQPEQATTWLEAASKDDDLLVQQEVLKLLAVMEDPTPNLRGLSILTGSRNR